jgi:hypothetical protein
VLHPSVLALRALSQSIMEVEKGYRALPVPLADGPCPCRRFVYIREHRDKQGGGGQGRTLFVANVDDQGEGGKLRSHLLEERVGET